MIRAVLWSALIGAAGWFICSKSGGLMSLSSVLGGAVGAGLGLGIASLIQRLGRSKGRGVALVIISIAAWVVLAVWLPGYFRPDQPGRYEAVRLTIRIATIICLIAFGLGVAMIARRGRSEHSDPGR
jgi:hypothetical protein